MIRYSVTVADAEDILAQAEDHGMNELFSDLAIALEPVGTSDMVQGAGSERLIEKVNQVKAEYEAVVKGWICSNQVKIQEILNDASKATRFIKLIELLSGWLLQGDAGVDLFGSADINGSVLERLALIILNDLSSTKLPEFCR